MWSGTVFVSFLFDFQIMPVRFRRAPEAPKKRNIRRTYHPLDEVIHNPVRLQIMAMLARQGRVSFMWLLDDIGLTTGNLGASLKRLQRCGYVRAVAVDSGMKPHTDYELTPMGRLALKEYLQHLHRILPDF